MAVFMIIAEFSSITMFLCILLFLGLKKRDYRAVIQILSGSLFGVTLEFFTILFLGFYTYSTQFIIQIGSPPDNVPICIGLCWGLIIYACMKVSDRIGLDEWSRPILDGLLALTIDFSMDTIAIRLDEGFWTWTGIPLESLPTINSFFGVNYGNFIGWFMAVLIFSFLLRIEIYVLSKKTDTLKFVSILYFCVIPFFAYFPLYLSLLILPIPVVWILGIQYNTDLLFSQLTTLITFIYIAILAFVIQIVAFYKSRPNLEKSLDWIVIIIFMSFHLVFFCFYFLGGYFLKVPLILPLSLFMFGIDIWIHWIVLDTEELRNQITRIIRKLGTPSFSRNWYNDLKS